jgi:hypothetical protein
LLAVNISIPGNKNTDSSPLTFKDINAAHIITATRQRCSAPVASRAVVIVDVFKRSMSIMIAATGVCIAVIVQPPLSQLE